jgi:hypothetical protein
MSDPLDTIADNLVEALQAAAEGCPNVAEYHIGEAVETIVSLVMQLRLDDG